MKIISRRWLGTFSLLAAFFLPAYAASLQAVSPAAGDVPAPHPLDLNGYRAQLEHWTAATERLKARPSEAAKLQQDLPSAWPVTIDGEHFSVPTDWLRESLRSIASNPCLAPERSKEIQVRLSAMRREADFFERRPALEPGTARQKLASILKRREFSSIHGRTWWDVLQERIDQWITEFLIRLFGRLGNHPVVYRRLMWAMAIALVAAFMFWLMMTFLRRQPPAMLDLHGPISVSKGWRDWAREALAASARGDYRNAIRLAYWSGVYRLEELGVWQIDRTRTPREYLRLLPTEAAGEREVQGTPPRAGRRDTFGAITSRFERVWYGGRPASADDFQSILANLEMLGCVLESTPATGKS